MTGVSVCSHCTPYSHIKLLHVSKNKCHLEGTQVPISNKGKRGYNDKTEDYRKRPEEVILIVEWQLAEK
jgi:hypothetical protein